VALIEFFDVSAEEYIDSSDELANISGFCVCISGQKLGNFYLHGICKSLVFYISHAYKANASFTS
jgi:hypothetical protein